MRTAARVLLETLRLNGVDRMFHVPGESFLALLDALYDERRIDLVTCRHESGAGFMALADARLTGRVGVYMATRGPGASNASIALHAAEQDAVPLLLIIGQVPRRDIGRGALQEVDFRSMYGRLVKFVAEIQEPDRVAEIAAKALRIAHEGVPGPVVLSIPDDVLSQPLASMPVGPSRYALPRPSGESLEETAQRIARAARPLAIAGGSLERGEGRQALQRFSEKWQVPVATSFRRLDLFPNEHEYYAGRMSLDAPQEQRSAFDSADLVVALGTRLGDFTTLGYEFPSLPQPRQPLIHVYATPAILGLHFAPELGIVADPLALLEGLNEMTPPSPPAEREPWIVQLRTIRQRLSTWTRKTAEDGVVHDNVIASLAPLLPEDAIVTADAGTHVGGVYRYLSFGRRRRLLAPLSGAMGYGVPAGVAAALRHPDRRVFTFVGDGGFMMTGAELLTAIARRLPLCVVLANNDSYASVRWFQEQAYPGRAVGTDLTNPDFLQLAKAFGCPGYRIGREEEIDSVLRDALGHEGPVLVEVKSSLSSILPHAAATASEGAK